GLAAEPDEPKAQPKPSAKPKDARPVNVDPCRFQKATAALKAHRAGGPASFGRHAPVQVAVRLGRALQVELLDLDRGEGLSGDQGLHVPVQVTAVGEAHLQPVQAALPLLDARLRAEAVFEEQERAAAS